MYFLNLGVEESNRPHNPEVEPELIFSQAFQAEVNARHPEIIAVDVLETGLEGLVRTASLQQGKPLRQRYDELCANIAVYEARLQAALTNLQNFKEGLDGTLKALQELNKRLDKSPPVSRNLPDLRHQAQQHKVRPTSRNTAGNSGKNSMDLVILRTIVQKLWTGS